MRKTLVIARREYVSATRTKSFIVMLVLMPLLMLGGLIVQRFASGRPDTDTYRVAIVDRTPDAQLAPIVRDAVAAREKTVVAPDGTRTGPRFELDVLPAEADADAQRLALSERVRRGELLGFAELGPNVVSPTVRPPTTQQLAQLQDGSTLERLEAFESGALQDEGNLVRWTTNKPTLEDFRTFLNRALQQPVLLRRLGSMDVDLSVLQKLTPVQVVQRPLASRGADGQIVYDAQKAGIVRTLIVPIALVALMFLVVITGSSPLATNILEEKQERVSEVLLSSVTPFELMLGKLVGGTLVGLTMAAVYLAAGLAVAQQSGWLVYLTPGLLAGFLFFVAVATFAYGALFVVAGAASTNIKEAQAFITPVMIFISMPFMVLGVVTQYPSGLLARAFSFFPLTAPMILPMRMAVPPGVAVWEMALSALCAIAGAVGLAWVAGRVFRAGMLTHAKGANLREVVSWVVRG